MRRLIGTEMHGLGLGLWKESTKSCHFRGVNLSNAGVVKYKIENRKLCIENNEIKEYARDTWSFMFDCAFNVGI